MTNTTQRRGEVPSPVVECFINSKVHYKMKLINYIKKLKECPTTLIPHILNRKLRNMEYTLRIFYFFTIIRKLALNIGGYFPNSEYTKIGVTEKSYDLVTFSHKTGNYSIHSKSSKKQRQLNQQKSISDIHQNRKSKPQMTQFRNFYNCKKNTAEHRL